jgi:hypothetical protein
MSGFRQVLVSVAADNKAFMPVRNEGEEAKAIVQYPVRFPKNVEGEEEKEIWIRRGFRI